MALRGPRSTADLSVVPLPSHRELEPPADMKEDAAAIFRDIVRSALPSHFRPADKFLVATLANLIAAGKHHARHGQHREWLQCCALQLQYSTKLRLTPSSRYDARASERTTRTTGENPPWADVTKDESNGTD